MWRQFLTGRLLAVANNIPRELAVDALHPETAQRRWNSNIKMTKQLKRLFDRSGGSKKKKIFPGPVNLGLNSSSEDADLRPRRKPAFTEGQKRRAHQVGRVLYDNIVQLVNSGQLSESLAAMTVEIVKVKVVPDFSAANIYWLSSGTRQDETVQTLLSENAGQLRHLLTSLHVLGCVPRLCFVRDDSQARYMEVEALLRTADFGPDFAPTRLDSAIRDVTWTRKEDDDGTSPEDQLQTYFNALNITGAADSPSRETCDAQEEKAGLQSERGSQNPQLEQDGSSGSRKAHSRESVAAATSLESEAAERGNGEQDTARRTPPPQSSSLDVHQLGSGDTPAVQDEADHVQKPASAMSEETAARLSKAFRDDVYKVPHSELLGKVLMKKQKAGLRPNLQELDDQPEETVVSNVKSTNLKSLVQKAVRPKGRLKRLSDFDERDLVQVHREDAYMDDENNECDEEVDDDLSAVDDDHLRK